MCHRQWIASSTQDLLHITVFLPHLFLTLECLKFPNVDRNKSDRIYMTFISVCIVHAVISFRISFDIFFLFPHLFVSLLFCLELENCCLYTNTNPVLVLNLIQLFPYKTVIIYVYLDVIRCLCLSVTASVRSCVGGGRIMYLHGFLTTTHFGQKCDK